MKRDLTRTRSEINITPYIDILLVLLIIFMIIQPSTRYQLGSRAPQKSQVEMRGPAPAIVLSIASDFTLTINQEPVELRDLGSRLFQILSARSDKRMFVHADREIPFGTVARIIDIAKGAGAGDIGLLTG